MLTDPEREAGITYTELGIATDGCQRQNGDCKIFCPRCHDGRRNRSDKSLSVNLDRGEWFCHHCQWKSGLGKEARNAGRVSPMPNTPNVAPRPQESRSRGIPAKPRRVYPTTLHPWAEEFLHERGISAEIAAAFQLGSTEKMVEGELKQTIHFPYVLNGEIVNVKHRTLPKRFVQEPGAPKVLYNIDAAHGKSTIVIVEGEADVIACHIAGWQAVSAPDGAPGEIFDHSTDPPTPTGRVSEVGSKDAAFHEPTAQAVFSAADRIIIATDDDLSGRALGDHLVNLFGPLKCWRVHWSSFGTKDANELLMTRGAGALDDALAKAKPVPLPGVRPLSAHKEKFKKFYREGYAPGVKSGWDEFDYFMQPELGKLIPVTGYPGHGKTSWLNHLLVNLSHINDWRAAIYSPEMGEEGEVLGYFVQIAADAPWLPTAEKRMSEGLADTTIDWVGERFWEIYCDTTDSNGFSALTVPQILARAEPLVLKHGIKVLVIDPWNQCESSRPGGMSVEEYIASSLVTMRNWAKRMGVTIFVVIHPRKPDSIKGSEDTAPHPYEAAGAAHWYNMADVFLTVHRVKSGEGAGITTVAVKKHRKEGVTGHLGECKFKYHKATGRFYFHEAMIPEMGSNPYPDMPYELYLSPPRMENAEIDWEDVPM